MDCIYGPFLIFDEYETHEFVKSHVHNPLKIMFAIPSKVKPNSIFAINIHPVKEARLPKN